MPAVSIRTLAAIAVGLVLVTGSREPRTPTVQLEGDAALFHGLRLLLDGAPPVTSRGARSGRAELRHGAALTEWYRNTPAGLEQGFDLAQATSRDGIDLRVKVTGLVPRQAGASVALLDVAGHTAAYYGQAHAEDARGRPLPIQLVAGSSDIRIHVETAGARFPVEIDPLVWLAQATLVASDGAPGDQVGWSVALLGDTALVGSKGFSTSAKTGAAYAFVRSGTTWSQQQRLVGSGVGNYDDFSLSVSLATDTALVGSPAPYLLPPQQPKSGSAYVFARVGSTWTQQHVLVGSDSAIGDQVGYAVAVDGTTALVGAPCNGTNCAGAIYAFSRSGSTWTETQKVVAAGSTWLGSALALDGDTVLSGARNANGGAAYVFVRSGSTWSLQQRLAVASGGPDRFGMSVALSGGTALVGATDEFSAAGADYVFVRAGSTWTLQQEIAANGLGAHCALDGDTALLASGGAALVYVRSGSTWTQEQKLVESGSGSFGAAVALSTTTALVGAPSTGAGAAYVFTPGNPLANGTACPEGTGACSSGFCKDGVCCDAACDQPCQTCIATPGTCTAVTNGPDADTCTGITTCNASGACQKKNGQSCADASECESGFCASGYCCASACAGACDECSSNPGVCTLVPAGGAGSPSCAPYACSGADNACPTTCAADTDCASGDYCNASGACAGQRAQGSPCVAGAECLSGFCVDGVCCDAACTGECEACTGALKGGGADGTCGAVSDGTDPDGDCAPFVCSGGSCLSTCATDVDCAAGLACFPVLDLCAQRQSDGVPCAKNGQCQSGFCVDGVCCDGACTGQCEACNGATSGTCSAVLGAPHGARSACSGSGSACAGSCDGSNRVSCTYPGASTTCSATMCSNGLAQAYACDGEGACAPATLSDCSPYKCSATGCATSCSDDADCAPGNACTGTVCAPAGSAGTGAGGTSGAGGGADSGASPGTGGNAAGSPGTASPGSSDSGGCGCRASGEDPRRGASWILLLVVGLARRRRARRGARRRGGT